MSEPSAFGFGQFVPGFDFLQNLSKTASAAQPTAAASMPGMASWVAPTLSIEDIDKRIQELKSVLFWLEQNTTALKATIQAMEVQKMTLTTLQSMNVNMADLAKAFTAKPPVSEPAPADTASASKSSLFSPKPAPQAATPQPTPSEAPAEETRQTREAKTAESVNQPAVDPMQWWGALTQQFQTIASAALKDVAGEAMKAGMSAKNAQAKKTASTKSTKTAASKPRKAALKPKAASGTSRNSSAMAAKTASGKKPAAKPAKPAPQTTRKTALK
jgi:hypothetical protein